MRTFNLTRYAIAGPQDFPNDTKALAAQKMVQILSQDITVFQYRDKGTHWGNQADRTQYVLALRHSALAHGVPFIVNDDMQLALDVGADGVHIGQSDEALVSIKKRLPEEMGLGLSINTLQQMKQVTDTRIDYLGLGPLFATSSKADATDPIGVENIARYQEANALNLPIVGIGGIRLEDLHDLKKSDLAGVAVISLLTQALDLDETIKQMKMMWS